MSDRVLPSMTGVFGSEGVAYTGLAGRIRALVADRRVPVDTRRPLAGAHRAHRS